MQIGREMLASGKQDTHLERFSLGASLGQCCGGVTVLLFEPMGQVQAQIAVFGAGHVGRALVPLLASLPCRVRWIDSREARIPGTDPPRRAQNRQPKNRWTKSTTCPPAATASS